MARIIIIGEGQTEQSFCKDVLNKYFSAREIYIESPVIKKTQGGIVNWPALKFQIEKYLKQEKDVFVTTLIDYYGIHKHHKYPNWDVTNTWQDKSMRIEQIECGMKDNLVPELSHRFVPYIQLHEFECLLFSDLDVINELFEIDEFLDYNYLTETIQDNHNPEMINDGVDTAASKRLKKIIGGYNKVVYGSLIAESIGLEKIRSRCPRFNKWIEKLDTLSLANR